jgi:hypothetical protein
LDIRAQAKIGLARVGSHLSILGLTGYACDTIPPEDIIAGKTKGSA